MVPQYPSSCVPHQAEVAVSKTPGLATDPPPSAFLILTRLAILFSATAAGPATRLASKTVSRAISKGFEPKSMRQLTRRYAAYQQMPS
jgi:hypothetical protein